MKLESTNLVLVANPALGLLRAYQKNRLSDFIDESHAEELRDLLNDYLALQRTDGGM